MTPTQPRLATVAFAVAALISSAVQAGTFSIATTPGFPFPSATPFLDDDLLAPGAAATLQVAGAGVTGVNINAVSFGYSGVTSLAQIGSVEFSVTLGSFAAAGSAVAAQAASGESGADIYRSSLTGTNTLVHDGDGLGPAPVAPPIGVFEPTTPPPAGSRPDEVDAWDIRLAPPAGSPVYFSADLVTGTSDAILFSTIGPGYDVAPAIYAGSGPLGLGLFGENDIDGLVVIDNDGVPGSFTPGVDLAFFSLAIGSATLAPAGATAGDILIDPAGAALLGIPGAVGLPAVVFTEAMLGLSTALSELDGFDFRIIPEPAAWLLAMSSVGWALPTLRLVAGRGRRRQHRVR